MAWFKVYNFGMMEIYTFLLESHNICLEPQTKDPRFAVIHKHENGKLIAVADGVKIVLGLIGIQSLRNYIFQIMAEIGLVMVTHVS